MKRAFEMPSSAYPLAPWTDVKAFGAVGNGVTDDTAAIQAAIDYAYTHTGMCFLSPTQSYYVVSQLQLPRPIQFFGVSPAGPNSLGSRLLQKPGCNTSLITSKSSLTTNDYMHWVRISDMYLRGDQTNNTLGCGIDMTRRMGECSVISGVIATYFPESGIRLSRGATPGNIYNCGAFSNTQYGFDLSKTSGDDWHRMTVRAISGDNNGTALVRVYQLGLSYDSFTISDVKAETSTAGKQQDVIVLEGTNGYPIQIENVTCNAIVAMNSIVKILSGASGARVQCRYWRAGTLCANWIDDRNVSKTLPRGATALDTLVEGFWHGYSTNPAQYIKLKTDFV